MTDFPLNKTEILTRCEDIGLLNAHREMDDSELQELLEGEVRNDELPPRHTNKSRLKIMQYILAHWEQVQPLLSCPARSGSPKACFNCSDLQVTYCMDQNPAINQEPDTEEEEDISMANNDFVARTEEEWNAIVESTDRVERTKVFHGLVHFGIAPGQISKMSSAEKVAKLVERQAEEGLVPAGAKGAKGGAKAAATGGAKAGAAAATAAPKTTTVGKTTAAKPAAVGGAKAAAAAASAPESSGGAAVGNADVARLEERVADLQAQLEASNEKLDQTSTKLDQVLEGLESLTGLTAKGVAFTMDAHAATRVLFNNLSPLENEAVEAFGTLTLEEDAGNG